MCIVKVDVYAVLVHETAEGDGEEMKRFCNSLNWFFDRESTEYGLCGKRDLNE